MTQLTPREIAAVVVLYQPDNTVLDNIRATQSQVARILAVDNTESPDATFVDALRAMAGVEHVWLGDNEGIAKALNVGLERISAAGFEWALTLDQDSTPREDMVSALLACAASSDCARAAIVSAQHVAPGSLVSPEDTCRPVLTTMTSGNLLSVKAWRDVGGFDESLFIDSVDHDFCLRLAATGLGVVECGGATIIHRVGQTRRTRFIAEANPSHHSALRRYYITRNSLLVGDRYRADHPEVRAALRRALRRDLVKIVMFEDDKLEKLRMSWQGYRDYKAGRLGKYQTRRAAGARLRS